MSLFQSAVALIYVILFIINACSFSVAAPKETTGVASVSKETSYSYYIMTALLLFADMTEVDGGQKKIEEKKRVKRDGAGKFSEAATMGPMKVLQLAFSFLRNIFSDDPIGGVHPMSPNIPGPVVKLFKQSITAKLFPELSPDH